MNCLADSHRKKITSGGGVSNYSTYDQLLNYRQTNGYKQ